MLICIDAGHGRYTPGKRCMKSLDPKETREWVLNSRVADKLQALLAGYDCTTMRVDDVTGEEDVALADRCAKANRAKADLYLSIHHNAGINGGSGGGIVVFTSTRCSQKSKEVQRMAYRCLIRQTGLAGNRAQPLQSKDLYVLRNTNMPAVLCECGFMDSAHDTPIILTDDFAQKAAQGLCDTLVEVYGLRATPVSAPSEPQNGYTVHTKYDGVHDYKIPVRGLKMALVDKPKRDLGRNECNAGYFGANRATGITVPAGHFVGLMEATDPKTIEALRDGGAVIKGGKITYKSVCNGKSPVTTLSVYDGKASMAELWGVSYQDYAVAGIPVIRHGKAVTAAEAFAQGWDRSSCRATKHIFMALHKDGSVHMLVMETKTPNLLDSGEAATKLLPRGYVDVIKLDGGGSLEVHADTGNISTGGNRRICTSLRFPRTVEAIMDKPAEPETPAAPPSTDKPPLMPELYAEAVAAGITDGSRPRDVCTREEAAIMAYNALEQMRKELM